VRLGVRAKLLVVSVAVVVGVVLAAGFFLEGELRTRLERHIREELVRHANSARALIRRSPSDDIATVDALVGELGAATETRVTVIAADGRVLGDSELTAEQIASVERHDSRPEVVAAYSQTQSISRRYSTTVGSEMLYVAVTVADPGQHSRGVVRVAKPLSEVDAAIAHLHHQLWVAGVLGVFVAIFMSALASHWLARALSVLADSARAIAAGETRRVEIAGSDELGWLAGSLNVMAASIERTVSQLAAERARFGAVLEGMSEGVIALDDAQNVTLMNPAALAVLELEAVPEGRPLVDIIRVPALHNLVAGEESPGGGVIEFDLEHGKRRILARVTPLENTGGCVIVLHDISALRRLETIRRDFVANVSHELRTPVSVIRANAETLLDGASEDPEALTTLLTAIYRNAERLSRIISELLDLSRLEAGRYDLKAEPVPVRLAAERALDAVERNARRRSTVIHIDARDDLLVQADAKALDQVLVNLLENAIKYTPEGSEVRVSANDTGKAIHLEVSDNGPGIPLAHQQRVFERFYRIDPGRSRDMGGTGLGLSIVKHLVEAMKGRVGVSDAAPHGALFWIELPRTRERRAAGR
jgi:two-component system, OmpR family, phosphate regulon sensor histidine kinase PhoR